MSLTKSTLSIVEEAARAIVDNATTCVDLYPLNPIWHESKNDIVEALTQRVEDMSDKRLSIRFADKALFASRSKGFDVYLVVVRMTAPAGTVTKLTSDMRLLCFGPYRDGFKLNEKRATPDEVKVNRQRKRTFAENSARRRALDEQVEANVTAFIGWLIQQVDAATVPVVDETATIPYAINPNKLRPNLEAISLLAKVCHLNNTTLLEVVRASITS